MTLQKNGYEEGERLGGSGTSVSSRLCNTSCTQKWPCFFALVASNILYLTNTRTNTFLPHQSIRGWASGLKKEVQLPAASGFSQGGGPESCAELYQFCLNGLKVAKGACIIMYPVSNPRRLPETRKNFSLRHSAVFVGRPCGTGLQIHPPSEAAGADRRRAIRNVRKT